MSEAIDWVAIEKWCIINDDIPEAARKFEVKVDSIRKRSRRHNWPLPSVIKKAAASLSPAVRASSNGAIIADSAKTLAQRGEDHAKAVFDLASNAIAGLTKLPIRNWKDAEIADKAARRAAGMGNDDEGAKISIIQLNEAINSHNPADDEIIDAEIIAPVLDDGRGESVEPEAHDNSPDNPDQS